MSIGAHSRSSLTSVLVKWEKSTILVCDVWGSVAAPYVEMFLVFKTRNLLKSMSVSEYLTAEAISLANERAACRSSSCHVTQSSVAGQQQDSGRLISTRFDKEVEGLKLNRSTQIP